MKTSKINETKGKVLVKATEGHEKAFHYHLETLFDWYPLNPKYDYLYSRKNNKMYIVQKEPSLPTHYGVTQNKDRINEDYACFYLDEWFNPEVSRENKTVFANARRWGIITPQETYTIGRVQRDLVKVGDILKILFELEEEHLERNIKNHEIDITYEELSQIMKSNREDYVTEVFKMNNTENENYQKLGEIYTMLQLMRKIVE